MARTTRAKPTTSVDDIPLEQRLCRAFTRHQWKFADHHAVKVGRIWHVHMPCSQCGKVTIVKMNSAGYQVKNRGYDNPDGWVSDRWLNTVAGHAAMRASLIPMLNEED